MAPPPALPLLTPRLLLLPRRYLYSNSLSGSLPSEFGQLTELRYL